MRHFPIGIVVAVLSRWINSCETYEQITTCEKLIENYILPRFKEPNYKRLLREIVGVLQVRASELQLYDDELLHLIQIKYSHTATQQQ